MSKAEDSFTLGSSQQVLQFTEQEIKDADIQLNRLLVKGVTYTTVGVVGGALLSVFFRNKVRIIGYTGGLGLGVALQKYGSGLVSQIGQK